MSDNNPVTESDTHAMRRFSEWGIRVNTVMWFVLSMGFVLSMPVLFGWASWVIVVLLSVAAVLAAPSAWVIQFISSGNRQRSFRSRWLRALVAWLFILSIAVAAPIYYLATIAELRPPLVPQAVLSDGEKTVVFQGMMHVGSENFYKSVIYDIEKALADGYVIYYESVQTETPESEEFFEKLSYELTGGEDLSGVYRLMSEACGLKFQSDYFTLLEADKKEHPERHVIADVDAIELKQEYERVMATDPVFAKAHADDFADAPNEGGSNADMSGLVEWLKSGSPSQRKLAGVIGRGMMTIQLAPQDEPAPGKFDPIILDFRNKELVKRIVEDPNEKIFITYGSNHLPGILKLLREHNEAWAVKSVKWLRTVEPPKNYQREFNTLESE